MVTSPYLSAPFSVSHPQRTSCKEEPDPIDPSRRPEVSLDSMGVVIVMGLDSPSFEMDRLPVGSFLFFLFMVICSILFSEDNFVSLF